MSAQLTQTPLCVVAGVGPGNGAAFARRPHAQADERAPRGARAYACDVGDPADAMGAQRSVIASQFAVAA